MTFGANGDLYLADTHNSRVDELTSAGAPVRVFGTLTTPNWGGSPARLGFDAPESVAVSASHVWVVDQTYGPAWFDPQGTWQGMSLGPSATDTFGLVAGVATDSQGNVFVADGGTTHRVVKYDGSGNYVCQFGASDISNPDGVVCGSNGVVYVADWLDGKVLSYTATSAAGTAYARTATWKFLLNGASWEPRGIALDAQGNVYVVIDVGSCIWKLSAAGKLMARWGGAGSGNGQFNVPLGVAVAPSGVVYVSDRDNARVEEFVLVDLGPRTYASGNLTVAKGKAVTFKYGVAEDVSPKATTTIQIKKGTAIKKTIKLGLANCGAWLTKKWTCKLPKGSYKWFVYATDQGGHAQVLVGSKSLKVT